MLASSYFLSPSWHRHLLECRYNIFPSQASPQESVPVPLTNRPPSQNIPSLNNKYPPDKKLSTWLRGLLGTLNVSGTFYDWGRFMTGDVSWRDVCLGDALYHGSYHQGTFLHLYWNVIKIFKHTVEYIFWVRAGSGSESIKKSRILIHIKFVLNYEAVCW